MRLSEVIDIGASPIDGPPPYQAMLEAGLCRVTGFEPQAPALAALEAAKGPNERYFPDAIGDGGEHRLNVYAQSGLTSFLTLNPAGPALFPVLDPRVVAIETVQTRRLDDLALPCDLLKIDVQGAELMIFQNGRETLAKAVAVQTEASYFPLYLDQPTHGQIDAELRGLGFIPFSVVYIRRWPLRNETAACHQVIDADWVYLRDYTRPDMSDEQLWHMAAICHHVYGASDLARLCLERLRGRGIDPGWSV